MKPINEFVHPETLEGEIFFMNFNASGFEGLDWETKRRGQTAYDGEGNKLSHEDWFPVFIKQSELDKRNAILGSLRKEWRARIKI